MFIGLVYAINDGPGGTVTRGQCIPTLQEEEAGEKSQNPIRWSFGLTSYNVRSVPDDSQQHRKKNGQMKKGFCVGEFLDVDFVMVTGLCRVQRACKQCFWVCEAVSRGLAFTPID